MASLPHTVYSIQPVQQGSGGEASRHLGSREAQVLSQTQAGFPLLPQLPGAPAFSHTQATSPAAQVHITYMIL